MKWTAAIAAMIAGLLGRGRADKAQGSKPGKDERMSIIPQGAFMGGRFSPLYRPAMSQPKRRRLARSSHR